MARILVVDDEPMNRELVGVYLDGFGHTILEAESGDRALEIALAERPDLVLLDVMMPGLNGFETARRLKQQTLDDFVPIVLLTALSDQTSRTLGLQMGADEFLTKPVDRQELLVRVNNLLLLREKHQALLQRNVEHAELHRFREEMLSTIVHDVKNPVTSILSNLDFLEARGGLDTEALEVLGDVRLASRRVLELMMNLLEVARIEAGLLDLKRARVSVREFVSSALAPRTMNAKLRAVELGSTLPADLFIDVDHALMTRVIENIVDNAIRHTPSGGKIEVSAEADATRVQVRIGNTGQAIPADERKLVFEKFVQGSSEVRRMNLGLGLYFCRLAVEAHGGRIWVDESRTLPTIFVSELPRS